MGNGYCLVGRDPVFADVDAHLAQIDADEEHAERVSSFIDDAVDDMLAGPQAWCLLSDVSCESATYKLAPLDRLYNRETGECSADMLDDWMRVMLYARPEHLLMLRQQWLDWVRGKAANYREVLEHAERLAAEAARDDAENAAAERAS